MSEFLTRLVRPLSKNRIRSLLPYALMACCFVSIALVGTNAEAARIGGWSAQRGGESGILDGERLQRLRDDLQSFYPGSGITTGDVLTSRMLENVDVMVLSSVFNGNNRSVTPLSAPEQFSFRNWIAAGGKALLVTDNEDYFASNQSLLEPFGLSAAQTKLDDNQFGTVINRVDFPQITDGRFGSVPRIHGTFAGELASTGAATTLATWDANDQPAVAAMQFGRGHLVVFADSQLLSDNQRGRNRILRRNTLDFLIRVPEPASIVLVALGTAVLASTRKSRRSWC